MAMSPKDELKRVRLCKNMAQCPAMCSPASKQGRGSLLFASLKVKFSIFFMEEWNGLEEGRFHGACKGGGKVYQWKGGERVYAGFRSQ